MKMDAGKVVRVLKRLRTSVGYHELGMTQHALRYLDSLTQLGKIGPFGLVAEVLRGEFVKHRENHVSAAKALEIVACMLPRPAGDAIGMTLAACYGQTSEAGRAAKILACARGAKPERQPKPAR
jgi:hypothetical protein